MKQVGFYHLTLSPIERALPALLAKTLKVGERAVVRCASAKERDYLDKMLWEVTPFQWLPHGCDSLGYAIRQPIWLTIGDDVPNNARFLFRIDGAGRDDFVPFTRIFDLFDGKKEESVKAARLRWKEAKNLGYEMSYWQQMQQGWQRKA